MVAIDNAGSHLCVRWVTAGEWSPALFNERYLSLNPSKVETVYRLLLVAAIITMCYSCSENNSEVKADYELENRLGELTEMVRIDSASIVFGLDTLTAYSWDTLIIVTPYYPIERIEQRTKIDLTAIKSTGVVQDEVSNVLAFIKNGQLISYLDLPRTKGDFTSYGDSLKILTPEKSIFAMELTDKMFESGQAVVKVKNK